MLIEIQKRTKHFYIVRCAGAFVPGPGMEYVQAKIEEIQKLKCARMVVDFVDVTAIGSIGATFIVSAYNSVMRQSGGRFVLAGANPRVRAVLDLTRISTVVPMACDVESGVAMLGSAEVNAPQGLCACVCANV